MTDTPMPTEPLTDEEAAAIAEAEAEIARGERVPAEVIEAFWRKHGIYGS